MLVVDDCSTDRSRAVILGLAKRDCRLKLIPLIRNLGVANARNVGLENITGDAVAFLDADDRWMETHVATSLTVAAEQGCEIVSSSCRVTSREKSSFRVREKMLTSPRQLLAGNDVVTSSTICSREAIGDVRFRNVGHEDVYFWYELLELGQNIFCSGHVSVIRDVSETGVSGNVVAAARWHWQFILEKNGARIQSLLYFVQYCLSALMKRSKFLNRCFFLISFYKAG